MTGNGRSRHLHALPTLLLGLSVLLGGSAVGSENEDDGAAFSLTPFSRVAVVHPSGYPVEQAKAVATAIAAYVATVDDTLPPTEFPANWILGGLEGEATEEAIEEAILRVPTPEPGKKVNIVEMCNPLFAKKALGVLPVVDGDDMTKIADGYIHAPALPCEVAIYAEEGEIRVDMLNPEAIFTLFFTDVLFGDQMKDPDFAVEIQQLPMQVNEEIRTIIYAALDQGGFDYEASDTPLGPEYESLDQVAETVADTPFQSPYVHFVYEKRNRRDFSPDDVAAVADSIIATLNDHPPGLDARLNMEDWRAARPTPLPIPGNLVIEACSPTNAIAAMSLGLEHATALPCEIAVKALNWDGVGGNELLMITYLDPHFMFSALFSDAFDQLSDEELEDFLALPPLVLEDLQTIVKFALRPNRFGLKQIKLRKPEQVFFDMLPAEGD